MDYGLQTGYKKKTRTRYKNVDCGLPLKYIALIVSRSNKSRYLSSNYLKSFAPSFQWSLVSLCLPPPGGPSGQALCIGTFLALGTRLYYT